MGKKLKITIFKDKKTGIIYEAYIIDNNHNLISGYKLFNGNYENNPFKIFSMSDVDISILSNNHRYGNLK